MECKDEEKKQMNKVKYKVTKKKAKVEVIEEKTQLQMLVC